MLRFPNPSSTIQNFVNVYRVAHQELAERTVDIDDIVRAVVGHNLATSSGHAGNQAIIRSTRTDRSRDPLFNQIKMYAELFRALGWLHPTQQAALRYTFTPLGSQVVLSGQHYAQIVGESSLGMAYPSYILLGQRGDYNVRPFSFLLRTMLECNGVMARDEMIVGPLSAKSDRSPTALNEVCSRILAIRAGKEQMDTALVTVARHREVQINTLRNYTRWPIALMRDLGWVVKPQSRSSTPDGLQNAYTLTTYGRSVAQRVNASFDLRADEIASLSADELRALSLFTHYRMLERSGFDVSSVSRFLDLANPALARAMATLSIQPSMDILFSPFQSLPLSDIQHIFQPPVPDEPPIKKRKDLIEGPAVDVSPHRDSSLLRFSVEGRALPIGDSVPAKLLRELQSAYDRNRSASQAAHEFVRWHRGDSQTVFYPLVRDTFELLGLKCETSRVGVNYQRWDACLWVDDVAIPIEVKSPAEEESISTKALRQAVENKIVLLARSGLPTDLNTTSLIVGYKLPNDRSDLLSLIDDVFATYRIRIGAIDLYTLIVASLRRLYEKEMASMDTIAQLKGFLRV